MSFDPSTFKEESKCGDCTPGATCRQCKELVKVQNASASVDNLVGLGVPMLVPTAIPVETQIYNSDLLRELVALQDQLAEARSIIAAQEAQLVENQVRMADLERERADAAFAQAVANTPEGV